MDPPPSDVEVKAEMLEAKEEGPLYNCDLFDREIAYKIAQEFLPGLASACVDNTTGLFKNPGSVAVDIRKDMVDYLTQRSETFVAESLVLEGGPDVEAPEHPYDIISIFIDDFASSKKNFFSRVSGLVLSERREDRIDDFVQELEINGFWLIGRREAVAQDLIKNVDFKNAFHCNMRFKSAEEISEHIQQCSFRTMNCPNEGCNARFTAGHMESHDSLCPFKILPCDQKCSASIMRREMDRHCITVCPMKLVNCPFYPVGCQSTIPRCAIEQHHSKDLHSHLLYILQVIHKEASVEDLKERVEQLEKSSSPGQLAEAQDMRSFTFVIKDLEAKLGPLVMSTKTKVGEYAELSPKKEECTDSPEKKENCTKPPSKMEESMELPTKNEKSLQSPTKKEESIESPAETQEGLESHPKKEVCREASIVEEG